MKESEEEEWCNLRLRAGSVGSGAAGDIMSPCMRDHTQRGDTHGTRTKETYQVTTGDKHSATKIYTYHTQEIVFHIFKTHTKLKQKGPNRAGQ